MNRIQRISQAIENDRLKLQMGLSPELDIDTLSLRVMWQQLCLERAVAANEERLSKRAEDRAAA